MRWLVFVVFLIPLGCAPQISDRWSVIPPSEELLAQLSKRSELYRSLDATASVSLTAKGKYYPSQQFLLLERPNRVRADVLTGFGQLVLQLASDGEHLAVYLNNSAPGRYFYGPASYENISRFVRIPLAAEDLVALLLYDPPLIAYTESRTDIVDQRLQLKLSGTTNSQKLRFDEHLRLVGCRYERSGQLALDVVYDKFDEKHTFPQRIKIDIPAEETRVVLAYSELRLNTPIDSSKFNLIQPDNTLFEALP